MTERVIEKWKQKIRSLKKEDYIVLLLIGVLLLIISLPTGKEKENKSGSLRLEEESGQENKNAAELLQKTTAQTEELNNNMRYELDIYVKNLEKRVADTLSKMDGAGKVQVMLTVSDMGLEILEKDTESNTNELEETDNAGGKRKNAENGRREEVIYQRDAEGNETPYVVQRKLPEVSGVVVLAEGAGNVRVKENIIEAVSVLFQLNEHRIKVIKMKS